MDRKILFIDVDGTLVDYENCLPDSAVDAIRKARAEGHRVYICTGRSKAEVYQSIWDIGLDGMIGGNGSYVEADGRILMHKCLTAKQCRQVVDWLRARGLEFYLESNNGLFASEHFKERSVATIQEYCRQKGRNDVGKLTLQDVFPEMIYGAELYRDDLNKISFILDSYQDYLDSMKEFPDLQAGTWGGAGETALFGELGIKGITKEYAINVLLQYLEADIKDTIAFGDAKTDISMLKCCNIGVAMGNGGEAIKVMADYVTDDVEKDGLYKAFVHLGLF